MEDLGRSSRSTLTKDRYVSGVSPPTYKISLYRPLFEKSTQVALRETGETNSEFLITELSHPIQEIDQVRQTKESRLESPLTSSYALSLRNISKRYQELQPSPSISKSPVLPSQVPYLRRGSPNSVKKVERAPNSFLSSRYSADDQVNQEKEEFKTKNLEHNLDEQLNYEKPSSSNCGRFEEVLGFGSFEHLVGSFSSI